MSKRILCGLALAALASGAIAQRAEVTLKVGDKAPSMAPKQWIKGEPVTKFEKGNVYVVEFWATWCGPCRQSIPHLTELAKKYAGKAVFTGVSVWEVKPGSTDDSYMPKVVEFVDKMGDQMAYRVAADGLDATMAKTWMEAAGQNGIPAAFVIDQNGTIAWIGHPMGELDEVLGKVIEGKFDVAAAARKQTEKAAAAQKAAEKTMGIQKALEANDLPTAIKEIDKLLATDKSMETQLSMLKYNLLLKTDEKEAFAFAKTISQGIFKDKAQELNAIAWPIVDDKMALKKPDYPLAVKIATRACELTKFEDPMILDTLAYAHFKNGQVDKAISYQEKAVALLAKAGLPEEMKKEITDRLAEFKKKRGVR
jgi:thiol-disulfide isomerase/thioredoxin